MDTMMQLIMERMSTDEKQRLMDGMMEKFFADLTPEEKQQMMASMTVTYTHLTLPTIYSA